MNINDRMTQSQLLDKIQIEGNVPNLQQVIELLKNLEARKKQEQEWNKDNEILKIKKEE